MSRSASLALVLVAIGIPFATWMHGRATAEDGALAQLDAHASIEHELDLALRRERTQHYLAVARDDARACEVRTAALRFLADEAHEDQADREWAKRELAKTHCRPRRHQDARGPVVNGADVTSSGR